MPDQLRVGLIGAGFMGRIHARSAHRAGGRIVAVAASTPERSRAAAATFRAERIVASPEELESAADIDVVHICAPNGVHVEYGEAALRSAKHVICEKPLATDAHEAASLVDLARSAQVIAAVPFVYRFYPTVREARSRVASGETGPLHLLHGSYLQDWMSRPDDWDWRVDPTLGGTSRALADIGSHWADVVEFVSGHRITRLLARLETVHKERLAPPSSDRETLPVTTEDVAMILFETDQGATGSFLVSQVSPGRKNRLWFELDGVDAALAFDQEAPESLWVGSKEQALHRVRDPGYLSPDAARLSFLPAGHPQGYSDCFDLFIADVYAAIAGDLPDGLPRFEDGARAVRLVEAAVRSHQEQRWMEVSR